MPKDPDHYKMSFGDHLEELRSRLLRGLIAPFLLLIPCLIFGTYLLELLARPVLAALASQGLPQRLQVLSPTEAFVSYFKVAIVVALVLSAPVLIWQLWKFVAPGLYARERRFAYLLIPLSAGLTVASCLFLYFVVLPLSFRMLIIFAQGLNITPTNPPIAEDIPSTPLIEVPFYEGQPETWEPGQMYYDLTLNQLRLMLPDGTSVGIDAQPDSSVTQLFQLKTYVNLVFVMILAFAITFQLPLVLLLLGWAGLVDVAQLRRFRKYALFGVFVLAAVMTPPDVISQIVLAVPLYLLYEGSILLLIFIPVSRITGVGSSASGESS